MDAALGFECALNKQFIPNEDFAARLGQEARIDRHDSRSLSGAGGEGKSEKVKGKSETFGSYFFLLPFTFFLSSARRGLRPPVSDHRLQPQETSFCNTAGKRLLAAPGVDGRWGRNGLNSFPYYRTKPSVGAIHLISRRSVVKDEPTPTTMPQDAAVATPAGVTSRTLFPTPQFGSPEQRIAHFAQKGALSPARGGLM
jgi:hypothetical protein